MKKIAYFSAEIGFSQNIPAYSGGLGILAGDHLKAATDLNFPLVGVTLLYKKGYFNQQVDSGGWQIEKHSHFISNSFLTKLSDTIDVLLSDRVLKINVWQTFVERNGNKTPVLLLDPDHEQNRADDREIAYYLYDDDKYKRLMQEIILGYGGLKAVRTLYPEVNCFHLNEGHTAFVISGLLNEGMSVGEIKKHCHYTTHTIIFAACDCFDYNLIQKTLGSLFCVTARQLAGTQNLKMNELALNGCGSVNAVSKIHCTATKNVYPNYDVQYITNGVDHIDWTNKEFANLYDKNLPGWRKNPELLSDVHNISDDDLLQTRHLAKDNLIIYLNSFTNCGYDPNILTIGFAKRAIEYKRAWILFQDIERLISIAKNKIQFVFAGKAHPRDEVGHKIIQSIIQTSNKISDKIRICFLSDYNIFIGKLLTSGTDLWLNTPRRPLEACGTSGMKASLNGNIPISTSDGWWDEAAIHGVNGWIVGRGYDDYEDAQSLYNILEKEVLPTYYNNKTGWANLMKNAIATGSKYTAIRMLKEYNTMFYKEKEKC